MQEVGLSRTESEGNSSCMGSALGNKAGIGQECGMVGWRIHQKQWRGLSPIWCLPVIRTGPEPDFRRKVTGGWSWKSSKLSWKEDKDEGLARPIL